MIFEFTTATIYETVGLLFKAANQCKSRIPRGGVSLRFVLYNANGSPISEYSGSNGDWVKPMIKDMYKNKSGSIEYICSTHARPW